MAQQFKVLVNAGKSEDAQSLLAEQGAGQRGRPLIIKAKAGAKYQLVEMGKGNGYGRGNNTDLAPDNIKAKRVGKHLHLMFETDTVADVIIEDYYDVMPEGYNGVIGKAENGRFYEYLTEDPTDPGLIPQLKDNVTAVTQALGGAEVSPAGAAIAVAAFPLLGALGLLGGAAAVAAAAKNNDTTTNTTTGKLDATAPNDSGVLGDNITNDATPTLSGTVPTGSTATVTINGQTYPVTVNADGTWSFTQPTNLPDGTYTPVLNVTQNGVTTPTNLTPFTIDTVTSVNIGNLGKVGATDPISGTAEPGDTVVVKDANGQVIGSATANSAGVWSLTPSAPVPAGLITATATDPAGNTATDTDTPANGTVSLKTALTIDPIASDNVLLAGESGATTYPVTGKVTGTFAPGDVVFLTLNGKTYPAIVKADGTYSTLVSMADLKADPDTKIEGSITPTGGDPATAAQDYTVESGNVPTQTALSINPVTADNIINSAEGTGSIAITGKVTGKFSAGDTVTLTVNNKTFSGQAAADGSYSIPVPAADLMADPDSQVDGTVTGSTLAKALQDYGVDTSPVTSPSLKTALTIDPIASDNVLLAGESGATTYPVTGKVTGTFAPGDVVFLSLNGKTYPAIVKADGTYSTLVSMADLKADPDTKIEGAITPTGGDPATAAQDYTVESGNVPTQTALSIDPVTADNILGSTESTGNITLTGHVTGKFSAGDIVKLTVAGVTYSGTAAADGSYSIPVPAAGLIADTDTQVDGTVTGTGGTVANATQNYGVDPNINPAPAISTGALTPTAPNDSGTLGDNLTNDNTPALSGTVPVGSTAYVTIGDKSYPATVNPDGTWTAQIPDNAKLPDGTYYPVLNVTTNGVPSKTNLTPFTIDTVPPTVIVTSSSAALAPGQTATITFTLSEVAKDFVDGDIAVSGGTLSTLVQSATNPLVYTATFTPAAGSTQASISVISDKFSDAAANLNKDTATSPAPVGATYEANNAVSFKTNSPVTGALSPNAVNPDGSPNDSGTKGDNLTNDKTPTLNGTVPPGSTANVTINGQTYPVTVDPQGNWTFTNPTNLPDGTYTPELKVTTNGQTTTTPITPFTIDTVPPSVIVTSASNILVSGQTTNVTFTLSEAVTDFASGDIAVTGGSLGPLTQSATDPKVWTAVFTPATGSTQATISVASDKFSDAAGNFNKDTATSPAPFGATYEANNQVTLTTNATASGQLSSTSDNSTGTPNDNKTNDKTPELSGKVPAGSTATVTVNGQTYPVTVNPDGTWNFTQPVDLPDGTYTPSLNVTTNGQTTSTPITPFTIDTLAPSVIVSGSNTSPLAAGQSATLTFTVSEATTNLTDADLVVVGGTLGPLQQSATNPLVYTATFTAATSAAGTVASVSVASDKFSDAAGNLNKDTATNPAPEGTRYEANNIWSSSVTPTSNPSLKTALTIDPITGDNIVTLSESGVATYTVTGKVTGTFAAGDLVTLTLNDKPFYGTVMADGTYSTVVPMADIKADSDTKIEGAVTGGNGGQYATAAQDYTVELTNAVTQTALSINPVTADNIIGSTESAGNIAITGKVTGKFVAGDIVTLTVKGVNYSGTAAADGSYSIPVPAADLIADSDTAVDGTVTGTGGTVAKAVQDYGVDANINPTPVDSTPPKIAISSNQASLSAGQTATITFAVSEATTDFSWDGSTGDIVVTGGSLAALTHVGLNAAGEDIYTAVFTPAANTSTTATIAVAAGKFHDAAGNQNLDTYNASADSVTGHLVETNNIVSLTVNTTTPASPLSLVNDTAAAIEAGVSVSGSVVSTVTGTNPSTITQATGVLGNDTSATSVTAIAFGSTNGTVGTALNGQYGTLTLQSNGTYAYTLNNSNASVNALAAGSTLSEVFTYTATDGTTSKTANLTITIQGTDDAPVAVADTTTAVEAGGTANGTAGTNPTGNVLTNDTDVDLGDTKTVSAIQAGITGTSTPVTAATATAATGITGAHGTLKIGTDGSYSYSITQGDAAVEALLPTSTPLTDTFTYTVKDAAGATSTNTITVSITGANDKPTVTTAIADTTGTVGTALTPINVTSSFADVDTAANGETATYSAKLVDSTGNLVNGGNLPSWLQIDPVTGIVTGTPPAGTPAGDIYVRAIRTDAGGLSASDDFKITLAVVGDTTPPTIKVERTNAGTTLDANGKETLVFTLSEASTNFDDKDIVIANGSGTITGFAAVPTSGTPATGYTQYTAIFTPTPGTLGTATIGVASGKFGDNAGNLNQDTFLSPAPTGSTYEVNNFVTVAYDTQNTNPVDNDKPTIQISIDKTTLSAGQTATLSFILSEASSNFAVGDITVIQGGGTVTNLVAVPGTNGTQYTATYTAGSSASTVLIGVAESTFSDAAGNQNADTYKGSAAGTSAVSGGIAETNNWVTLTNTGSLDTTPPTVAVTRTGTGTVGATGESIVFTFSEGVPTSSFTLSDIDATGGAMSNLVPVESSKTAAGVYTQYSATYTPTSGTSGTASIGVAASKFTDVSGNNNLDTYSATADSVTGHVIETNNQVVLSYNASTNPAPLDTTAPTIAISADKTTLATDQSATITFTLSEASNNFTQSDVVTTGGGLSNWTQVNATTYTATFTATAGSQSTGSVHVASNSFTDAAPNYNQDGADLNNTVNFITNSGVPVADTTPPTIAITSNQASLTTGQTALITFTLSEASTDFTWNGSTGDIVVTGGLLSALTPVSGSNGTQYTATFTPATNSTVPGVISVAAGKFTDAAGLQNLDTYSATADVVPSHVVETNNQVSLTVNTTAAASPLSLLNDTATAIESGVTSGNVPVAGTNPSTTTQATGVLGNDTSATSVTAIAFGSTNGTLGTALNGQYGTLTLQSNGTYAYTLNNSNASVNALAAGSTLSEVFTYTATDGTTSKTANLTITIQGTDDAPVAVADTTTAVEAGGTANGTAGTNPTGNVLTNDTDVDLGDTKTVSAIQVGITGTSTPVTAATATAATGITGAHGTLKIGTDGSYSYSITQGDAAVEALLPTSTPLTDTFTYTVKDAAGATSTNTITVSITGANDKPTVTTAIADTTGTVGTALTPINVTSSFADVDTAANGETATYSAKLVDSTGNLVNGGNLPSWLQIDPVTGIVTGVPPLGTAAGDIYIRAIRTDAGGLSASDDFKITLAAAADTTPPTIAITSNQASLTSGQTATITFTMSEVVTGFVWDPTNPSAATNDIVVTGGTLGALTQSSTDPKVYTATFTPAPSTTATATIGVANGKFIDAASNPNLDTYVSGATAPAIYEANNQVSLSVNTTVASSLTLINDTATAIEAGVSVSGSVVSTVTGTNPSTTTQATGVLGNDTSANSVTAIAFGSTNGTVGTALNGQYGSLTLNADGTYTYTLNNSNASVNALAAGSTLSEVFTYTATDGTTSKTANLTITIQGTDDAPVAVADTTTAVEAGGTANGTAGTNPAGNVLTNDTDVDLGDTKTVSAILAGTTGTATTVSAASAAADTTGITGAHGTLKIGTDGSYSYSITQGDAAVEALLPTSTPLTDTFTYTVKDAAGATSTNTITVSITGANDKPTVTTAIADTTGTVGTALTPINVTSSFADVDTAANGETATYSAKLVDSTGNLVNGGNLPSWLQIDPVTGIVTGVPPLGTAAGDIYIRAIRTDAGGLSASDDFKITLAAAADTTPPTIAITSNQASLTSGQTATITFTISEATTDFAWDGTSGDLEVSGGSLSALTHVGVNAAGEDIYTAIFTPATNSTTPGEIKVAAGQFTDAAGLQNKDTWNSADTVAGKVVETNNTVTLTVNTANAAATLNAVNDSATAVESGTSVGTNVTKTAAQGVLINDSGTSPTVTGVQLQSATTSTAVSAGTTSATGTTITGQYGTLVIGADGSYNYTVDNSNPLVQALRTSGQTLTESFSYTITDATGQKTANLAITVQGANDAVVAVADTASALEAGGSANATAGTNPSGNVLTNDTDVDLGDTKVVQDIRPGTSGTLATVATGSTSTGTGATAGTTATGSYGSLVVGADGSYVYNVDNTLSAVQALRTSSQTLTDTFTYTVKDTAGATSTNTITVTVGGANDAPTVTTAIADTTATIGTALTSFAVTGNFADVDTVANGETATYSAQLVDSSGNLVNGGALPSWLQIDATTGTFSGTPPVGTTAGDIYIRAIRTDAGGLTVSDDFKITLAAGAITTTVSFSSMTKDSGTAANADWTTNDASAGRLVSGQISAPLAAGEVVKVYANGVEVGTAVVNGTQWEITDLKDYNANWTYTAQVVGAANNTGPMSANRLVTLDATEAVPVITGVFDTASSATTIANNGSTSNALSTVKGTGLAGDTIFLYDNTYTNLVGTAVVDTNGDWSVTTLTNTFGGSNTFAAKQVDVNGNQSGLSNQWTVTTPATALNANSGFSSGVTGYTTDITPIPTTQGVGYDDTAYIWGGNRIGVIDLQSYYQPNYSTTNPDPTASGALPIQVSAGALSAATAPATWGTGTDTWTQSTYNFGAGDVRYTSAWKTFAAMASGKVLAGSADGLLGTDGNASSASNLGDLWRSSASVVAGKTYEFSFAYWNTAAKNLSTAGFMDVMIDGQKAMSTTNDSTGKVTIKYTATTTGSIDLALQSWSNSLGADFVLDNLVFSEAPPANTLGATTAGNGPTANPDTLSYTNGALDALASDDTITVTNNTLQATLAAGGMISGGAGVDTLKLAAGTTLNLGTLTTNQTVRNIEQIEIFEMQGSTSSLSMTANDVLSLGGTNTGSTIGTSTSASPMAPYSFAATVQSNDTAGGANTVPTGSTSSAGKVQMVVHGVTGDTLNLNKLAVDGTVPAGNTGLEGFWAYKGQIAIGGITYKVYDHSTTQAQVLVDVAVTMNIDPATVTNTTATIDITAITNDSATTTDYITTDNTLTYSGTLTNFDATSTDKVLLELKNASNVVVGSATVVPSNGTWTWVDPVVGLGLTRPDGTYSLVSTIVNANGVRVNPTAPVNGTNGGQDTQVIVIDTVKPNGGLAPGVVITTDTNNNAIVNADELAGASTFTVHGTFDPTKVAVGDKVVFTDGTTTKTVILTSTDITNGYAVTTYPKPAEGGTLTVTATIVDVAGNSTPVSAPDSATLDTSVITTTVDFSSMTKDTGISTGGAEINANINPAYWTTSDTSAGRLVSGSISAALATGQSVEVYANGVKIGNAVVNGTQWAITDLNGYGTNASWTYTAKVVNTAGTSGTVATQLVNTDFVESAPTITGVLDTANASVGATGTNSGNLNPTTNALTSVSGTASAGAAAAGSMIYLYDNSNTNLVGSAVVDGSGNWTVSGLKITIAANSFAAKQVDVNGNESPLSNLWTVNTTANGITNGNFSSDLVGFTTDVNLVDQTNPAAYEKMDFIRGSNRYSVIDLLPNRGGMVAGALPGSAGWNTTQYPNPGVTTQSATKTWAAGTWNENVYVGSDANYVESSAWGTFYSMASGKILGGSGDGLTASDTIIASSAANPGHLWKSPVDVIEGQTYKFSFVYWNTTSKDLTTPGFMDVTIDGQVAMTTKNSSAGRVTVTYTATKTGKIDLSLDTWSGSNSADYALDNITFNQVEPNDGSLMPGGTPPATPQPDNLTYEGGPINAMESNDVINVSSASMQSMLTGGNGYINGGAGMDTLKLAAGTTLNLDSLTRNQTVQPIQQVEIFQLQGSSTLSLTANDVLSLGGANATTMSPFTFSSTTGGTGSANSTGKVQFVVNGLTSDTVNLNALTNDAVLTNGAYGNTGLAGVWNDMGTTIIGTVTYHVYNHSTTEAQVLIAGAAVNTPTTAQSVVITRADSTAASVNYVEEFTTSTTANNTLANTIETPAWSIKAIDFLSGDALVNELQVQTGASGYSYVDTGMGTDAKLKFGPAASAGNSNEPRLNTFTSKAGEFSAISFNYIELNSSYAHSTNGGSPIEFFDDNGVLVHSAVFTVPLAVGTGTVGTYSLSLPAGVKASSFSILTNTNDQWFMDGLSMTTAATTYLPHTSATVDATPLLSGTYSTNLNVGDVVKIYDATGTNYLGDATVDPLTKTWTYQLTTPQAMGLDTYVAKIVSSASATVATSNQYTLNVLASSLNINSISDDTGTSTTDFMTSDNTLVYNGQLPKPLATGEKVLVQIYDSTGTTLIRSSAVTPTAGSTTWTWSDTGYTLADGNYIIKATIVATDGVTPVAAYGTNGTDTQPMTIDATAPTQTVAFSSMTKDSGTTNDWTTADASAGRLVSGSVSAVLAGNEVLEVYANGVKIGNAVVNGTAWEITDTSGYTGNWEYTAKVVNAVGSAGPVATRAVTTDLDAGAIAITGVKDATSASVADNGTTANALTSVTGTAAPLSTVYLYDNSLDNLVGTAVADGSGNWTVSGLSISAASNTFVAKHLDTNGNESDYSNQWHVGSTKSAVNNGNFEQGLAGFGGLLPKDGDTWGSHTPHYAAATKVEDLWVSGQRRMDVIAEPTTTGAVGALVDNNDNSWMYGTWSESVYTSTSQADVRVAGFNAFLGLASGNFLAGHQDDAGGFLQSLVENPFTSDGQSPQALYGTEVTVVKGKTYVMSFDYYNNGFKDLSGERDGIELFINGVKVMATKTYSAGHVTVEYTAPTDGEISLSLQTYSMVGGTHSAYALDNISFQEAGGLPDGGTTLSLSGPTENADSLNYTSGSLDALGSNDKITVSTTSLQTLLGTGGGYINGGAGVDTLKLAAGTSLDLMTLTANQTVKPIQQIEVFELQGKSSLTLTANDVLSLGGANASTMSVYSFASTTQAAYGTTNAAGSTSSTGKVQFVVNGTSTDQVVLANLATDGVTTNSVVGNTGLAGQWDYKGTTSVTVNGVTNTYRVYDHSTTQAQVLIDGDASSSTQTGGVSGGTGSSTGGNGSSSGSGGSGGASATNGVMITSVQATGTTTKVMTETFDGLLQYENTPMRTFITDSGMEFHWAYATDTANSGNFLLGNEGSGLNGQGRALHVNGAYLPGSGNLDTFQIFQQQGNLTRVEFDYWGLSGGQQTVYTDTTLAGTDITNKTSLENTTPNHFSMNVTGASHLTDQGVFLTQVADDDFFMDNIKFYLDGAKETVDVSNGGTTRYTAGTVTGTLASPLATGQKVEVFSGTTSMGFANVVGISWSIADATLSASGEVYTAKIVNADNSVQTTSGSYAINQTATTTPKLTISDDALSTEVGTGTSINYTFAFDQAVTGFDASDVTVTGGTKGALTQIDSKTWTMTVTANTSGAGNVVVSVADGAYMNSTNTVAGLAASNTQAYGEGEGIYKVEYFLRSIWGSITYTGTDGNDVMDAVGDTYFQGRHGGEKLYAGAGDDIVIIDDENIIDLHTDVSAITWDFYTQVNAVFDGGTGTDTLRLTGGHPNPLDLQNLNVQKNLSGFEIINLLPYAGEMGLQDRNDTYGSTVKVNLAGIQAVSDTDVLTILADNNDVVRISSSAYIEGTATMNGQAFKTYDLNSDGKIDLYVSSAIWIVSVASGVVTPLVLDLNGDGVQTTGLETPVTFDIDADGQVDNTAWTSAADGLLAMDLNGDGQINSGAELFGEGFVMPDGSKAADGFAALATLDTNRDGVVDATDAKFNDLRLWVDANSNGHTDQGELKTLADVDVASLNLNAQTSTQENNGNVFGLVSSYTKTDGTYAELVDVLLAKGAEVTDSNSGFADPTPTSVNEPTQYKLTAADVLQQVNANGQALQVKGNAGDTLELFTQGTTPVQTSTTDYAAFDLDRNGSVDLLVDQAVRVSMS